jgi:type II secretory ATPase GspE/PulE/Tfp pilus assembly ATPase PilB-like protein
MLIKRLEKEDKGSYCTFHAQSARDAITRLKKLGVLEIDLLALDLIVMQKRWTEIGNSGSRIEKRRITEIVEVLDNEGCLGQNVVFEFDYSKDCLRKVNESIRIKEKFQKALGSGRMQGFEEWLEKKGKELNACLKKNS